MYISECGMSVPVPCPDGINPRLTLPEYVSPRKSHSYRSGMTRWLGTRRSLHRLVSWAQGKRVAMMMHGPNRAYSSRRTVKCNYLNTSNKYFSRFFSHFSCNRSRSPTVQGDRLTKRLCFSPCFSQSDFSPFFLVLHRVLCLSCSPSTSITHSCPKCLPHSGPPLLRGTSTSS